MTKEENLRRTEEILNEASRFEWRGRDLLKKCDYHGAVEAAQHCIELAIKTMYHLVGIHPPKPKSHDMGVALEHVVRRFDVTKAYSYLNEDLARMRFISTMWAWAHSTSMYGCLDLPASRIFRKKDATIALEYASDVLSACRRILNLVRFDQIRVKEVRKPAS